MAARPEELLAGRSAGAVDVDRDRRLVLAHQAGDADAFDELYRRYHGRLLVFCLRRVGDRHVAEELAHDTFVRALQALPRFGGDRRFYPWLTVIAARLCIDHHRRTARVEPAPDVDPGSVEPEHDAVFAAVDRAHLHEAIDRLAPRHREVLALREQRRWSYQRIAEHLEVPTSTVEALLHRARRALRREFLAVGGGRVAGLPMVSGLAVGLGRLRARVAGVPTDQLAPWATSAAAGIAAVGFAVSTLGGGPSLTDVGSVATPVTTPIVAVAPAEPALPAPVTGPPATPGAAPVVVIAVPPPGPAATRPATPAPVADLPPPSIDLGVATHYPGPEGRAHVDQQIAEMPLQVDLGPLANIGLDPAGLVADLAATLLDPALLDRQGP